MNHVGRLQLKLDGFAHWQVDLVGEFHERVVTQRVTHSPPPLVTSYVYAKCVSRGLGTPGGPADNPARAETFIDELIERSHSLALHPLRFPAVGELRGRTIRKLTHGGYLIFYLVGEQEVYILRIVHGSRDWAALFSA